MTPQYLGRCPNPECRSGQVHHRGTTGPTGDDPSDWLDCPVCRGQGVVHADFAREELARGFCHACRRYHWLAVLETEHGIEDLCYACWLAKYHPELVSVAQPPIPLEEIPF